MDIDAGTELTRRIMKMVPGIGGFSGGFTIGILLNKKLQNFIQSFGVLMSVALFV